MITKNIIIVVFLLLLPSCLGTSSSSHDVHRRVDGSKQQLLQQQQPNFVILLTDDLDWTLGGANASTLYRTRHFIGNAGTVFRNWFVQTPVCCPSRAELLTGKAFHNLRQSSSSSSSSSSSTNSHHGCMHVDVQAEASHPFYERDYFARFFAKLNYTVGIFGKHLNHENPADFMPPGVDEMLLNGGGVYMNPTFTVGTRGTGTPPRNVKFDNCTSSTGMPCYSTSIIGNASLAWITRHVQNNERHTSASTSIKPKPFLALIAPKAPHLLDSPGGFPLSVPAPWYQSTSIPEQYAPRTAHYNYSAQDHHWLVRSQQPLTEVEAEHIDDLYVSRLKTMISVDDIVEELIAKLRDLRVLDHTYILFTSDHGYRLGQFRMPCGKFHPYENDLRVPMMMRGPEIRPRSTSNLLATHVDLMPTLLGLATGRHRSQDVVPPSMDGTNLAAHIVQGLDVDIYDDGTVGNVASNETDEGLMTRHKLQGSKDRLIPPPQSILVEYISLGRVFRYNHTVDTYNHTFLALRILMPKQQSTDRPNDGMEAESIIAETTRLSNYKYVEFRDARTDWNCSQLPLEREFYDLDRDPNELSNLIDEMPTEFLQSLHARMQRMFHCKGDSCRKEQATGLYWIKPLDAQAVGS